MLRDTTPAEPEAWLALRDAALREAEALADYPLLAMLGEAPGHRGAANLGMLVEVLGSWTAQLEAELRQAMPATTDAVRHIRDRVRGTHAALSSVLALARQLQEAAGMAQHAGHHPIGAAGRFVPSARRQANQGPGGDGGSGPGQAAGPRRG